MNIDDVKKVPKVPDGGFEFIFQGIFVAQEKLMSKYHLIELANQCSIIPSKPYHVDNSQLQARVKDMFWRTVEEVAEAHEVIDQIGPNWRGMWNESPDVRHFFEEIADAIHFMVEASILVGVDHQVIAAQTLDMHFTYENFHLATYNHWVMLFFIDLGLAANCLKNKPWKTTHVPTDIKKFHAAFTKSWRTFLRMFQSLGLVGGDIWNLYFQKNEVNQFRQRTNY